MDSSSKISCPSQSRSTSKIIKKIHTMSWLKQDLSPSNNSKSRHQAVGKDGKIISQKKTNEDYFPGTREEKRTKKKKEKKGRSAVVIANLQDLVSLTQQNEKGLTPVEDSEKISTHNQPIVEKEVEIASGINTTAANGTIWSNTSNTADKLFPNVQSVRIDRSEEEEMLSRAIAESIVTVQLEQFKRPSLEKENRWEALYGDFEDEGSWENVRRNLPTELETKNSGGETSGQMKSRDDNNNSSKSGILRNKRTNLHRYLSAAEEHDFCFKTSSERSKDESEKAQSLKSVSFVESIVVKVRSSESSVSDESDKSINVNERGPNIDKYGRVDGYSERRLFMGKGARIREQEYIQSQCSLRVGDSDLELNPKASAINKTRKPDFTPSQCPKNLQSQKPIPKLENPKSDKTIAVNNFRKTPEIRFQKSESNSQATAIVKAQKLALNTSHCPRNIQSQKSIPNPNNPKTEKAIAVINAHRTPEISKDVKRGENNVEEPNESVKKSPGNRPSLDIASNTSDFGASSNQKIDSHVEKQKAINATEVESISYEISSLSQREGIAEIKKDVKDLQGNIPNEDMISKNSLTVSKTLDDESNSEGPCLVPTLVRQDGFTPNLFASNFQYYTESISAVFEAEFQSPACQNLLLAGVSCQDANLDAQSFTPRYLDPENLQYQNYSIPESVSLLESQIFNNARDIQAECGNQINRNPPMNCDAYSMLPNYARMYETEYAYFMHRPSAGNFPYQNVSLMPDPDHRSDPNFTERGETGLPSTDTEHLEPITDLHEVPAREKTDNDRRRFLTAQAPPGLIKNLRLPSGFTRKESTRRCDADEKNLAIKSPTVTQRARARDTKSEKAEFDGKKSRAQNRTGRYEKNSGFVKTNGSPSKKQQNFHKPQTADSDREKSQLTENRKLPYPILGANQRADEKYSNSRRAESETGQSSKSRKKAVNNRSPNARESYRGPNPNNNNYSLRRTQNTNSDLNRQGMNDPLQNFQSGVPAMCQMADRLSPGSSNASNWQYNLNFMNPTQVPMNLSSYYQMPVPNPRDLPANISPDYFHAAIHPNGGFHQLPMHLQMPVYSIPHLMNTGVTDGQNMRPENPGSPGMNSASNHDFLLQSSIIGDHYSPNETSMGQFVPNSNLYEIGTMPSMASAWNMHNNQTENNAGQIFDNFNAGRGRGRLAQKNDF